MTEDVDASSQRGQDYQSITTSVPFQAGERQKSVTIVIEDDSIKEDTEGFKVLMQRASSSLLDPCSPEAQVQIKDDDGENLRRK